MRVPALGRPILSLLLMGGLVIGMVMGVYAQDVLHISGVKITDAAGAEVPVVYAGDQLTLRVSVTFGAVDDVTRPEVEIARGELTKDLELALLYVGVDAQGVIGRSTDLIKEIVNSVSNPSATFQWVVPGVSVIPAGAYTLLAVLTTEDGVTVHTREFTGVLNIGSGVDEFTVLSVVDTGRQITACDLDKLSPDPTDTSSLELRDVSTYAFTVLGRNSLSPSELTYTVSYAVPKSGTTQLDWTPLDSGSLEDASSTGFFQYADFGAIEPGEQGELSPTFDFLESGSELDGGTRVIDEVVNSLALQLGERKAFKLQIEFGGVDAGGTAIQLPRTTSEFLYLPTDIEPWTYPSASVCEDSLGSEGCLADSASLTSVPFATSSSVEDRVAGPFRTQRARTYLTSGNVVHVLDLSGRDDFTWCEAIAGEGVVLSAPSVSRDGQDGDPIILVTDGESTIYAMKDETKPAIEGVVTGLTYSPASQRLTSWSFTAQGDGVAVAGASNLFDPVLWEDSGSFLGAVVGSDVGVHLLPYAGTASITDQIDVAGLLQAPSVSTAASTDQPLVAFAVAGEANGYAQFYAASIARSDDGTSYTFHDADEDGVNWEDRWVRYVPPTTPLYSASFGTGRDALIVVYAGTRDGITVTTIRGTYSSGNDLTGYEILDSQPVPLAGVFDDSLDEIVTLGIVELREPSSGDWVHDIVAGSATGRMYSLRVAYEEGAVQLPESGSIRSIDIAEGLRPIPMQLLADDRGADSDTDPDQLVAVFVVDLDGRLRGLDLSEQNLFGSKPISLWDSVEVGFTVEADEGSFGSLNLTQVPATVLSQVVTVTRLFAGAGSGTDSVLHVYDLSGLLESGATSAGSGTPTESGIESTP